MRLMQKSENCTRELIVGMSLEPENEVGEGLEMRLRWKPGDRTGIEA